MVLAYGTPKNDFLPHLEDFMSLSTDFLAYRLFMNVIDRFDQFQSTTFKIRRDKIFSLLTFTYLTDCNKCDDLKKGYISRKVCIQFTSVFCPTGKKTVASFSAAFLIMKHERVKHLWYPAYSVICIYTNVADVWTVRHCSCSVGNYQDRMERSLDRSL